jgi:signal transduction histidine kinase
VTDAGAVDARDGYPTGAWSAHWRPLAHFALSRLVVAAVLVAYAPRLRGEVTEAVIVQAGLFGAALLAAVRVVHRLPALRAALGLPSPAAPPAPASQPAQQLQLASMSRLSGSIAHEIRNPLAAILHANGLLAERLAERQLQRLATIVEDNCRRINRVIEDVLSISRRGGATPEAPPAAAFLARTSDEYVVQSGADPRRIACRIAQDAPIWFDAGHLRQRLLNLRGNALRHASPRPDAVGVEWVPQTSGRAMLIVGDDGPGVPPVSRVHLFEPFFTTEARGTGLGLHLARELCTANGATIRYRPASDNPAQRSAFVVEPAPVRPDPAR